MREIKFRVWNSKIKQMQDWEEIKSMNANILFQDNSECSIMQYTGLWDGSKAEYYEGDIIEADGDWYEIQWEEDYGQWLAVSLHNKGDSMSLGEFHNCSDVFIQGNIYQNPELLKEAKS